MSIAPPNVVARGSSHGRPRSPLGRAPVGLQVLGAVAGGVATGTFVPSVGVHLQLLGQVFLHLVQMVVIPLVFPLVVLGIARMESARAIGRLAGRAVVYFEIVTTVILLMAVGLAEFLHVGEGADVGAGTSRGLAGLATKIDFQQLLLNAVPSNVFAAFSADNLLAVLVFAIFFGMALAALGEKAAPLHGVLDGLASVMFKVVEYVVKLAPLGVLGFVAYDVSHYGLSSLSSLLGFLGTVYLGLALIIVGIFPVVAVIFKVRYVQLLRSIADLVGLAFVTRSSESVLAPLLQRLERLGVDRSVSSFVLPLGYSFNSDGSVLYQAIALVFLSNAYHLDASPGRLLLMVGVLVVLSKGMAGVASASIVVLIAAAGALNLPPVGIALLLGVDFAADMARTAVNVVGNSLACLVLGRKRHAPDLAGVAG